MSKIGIVFALGGIILLMTFSPLRAQEVEITNELIYRELKIFEAKTEERFKAIDQRFEQIDQRFEQIDKRFEQIDQRFEQINARFGDMFNYLWIIATIFTAMVVSVIGFGYWDRRTIIRKAREETIDYIEHNGIPTRLHSALRELAKKDKNVADVLKQFNLL